MSKSKLSHVTFEGIKQDVKEKDLAHAYLCALWVSVPAQKRLGAQFEAVMHSIYEAFLEVVRKGGQNDVERLFNDKIGKKTEHNPEGRDTYPWAALPQKFGSKDPDVCVEWLTLIVIAALKMPYFFEVEDEKPEDRLANVEKAFRGATKKYGLFWWPCRFGQAFQDAKGLAIRAVPK